MPPDERAAADADPTPHRGFRDRAAHDRAHELLNLPSWHPDAPTGGTRHVLKRALARCLNSPGYCDWTPVDHDVPAPSARSEDR